MKTILIVTHSMELGGAEKSLLGLLTSFDFDNYSVDLFLMRQEGDLLKYIPEQVHLLPEISEYTCLAVPIQDVIKKGKIHIALGRYIGKKKAKQYLYHHPGTGESGVGLEYSHRYTKKYMPMISEKEYDVAISFLTPHYFVSEKVRAKKRIAWIHTDYSQIRIDRESENKMWSAYNYIISVSDSVTEGFVKVFPELKDKVRLIENILPEGIILNQAMESVDSEMEKGQIKLLSIGRYTYAKNFDNVPHICRQLIDFGLDVCWYLIGFGPDENLIKQRISEEKMNDRVILLGKKENPYPYIKKCDVYIQPSRYEGKNVAVREAQMLGKPVVISRYASSSSQLEENLDGFILPQDNDAFTKGLCDILRDKKELERITSNCQSRDYSNKDEIRKIYNYIEKWK